MPEISKGSYIIVRAPAGHFVGTVKRIEGDLTVLTNARRLWFWTGAASLSELAQVGTSKPASCKFPCAVDEVHVLGTIERLAVTPIAQKTIEEVPVWTQH